MLNKFLYLCIILKQRGYVRLIINFTYQHLYLLCSSWVYYFIIYNDISINVSIYFGAYTYRLPSYDDFLGKCCFSFNESFSNLNIFVRKKQLNSRGHCSDPPVLARQNSCKISKIRFYPPFSKKDAFH